MIGLRFFDFSCKPFHLQKTRPGTAMKVVNSPLVKRRFHVLHPPRLGLHPVDYSQEYGGDDDPKQLEPVEEWDADESWILEVVERGPEHDEKRDEE
jgi:hypothetical protein